MSSSTQWRILARIVVEEHLGRPLTSDELVHHKDKNITNCSIDNLEIKTKSEHNILHHEGTRQPWAAANLKKQFGNQYRKGKFHTQETKDRISKTCSSYIRSKETCNKISAAKIKYWQKWREDHAT